MIFLYEIAMPNKWGAAAAFSWVSKYRVVHVPIGYWVLQAKWAFDLLLVVSSCLQFFPLASS